ncbi:MAG: class I SAM-dependent methyltransferase [Candidatus Lokiarchaeota archaeon]|nr:class I SAM-dependent methyltransferase [Candidatus Lokiarchaeota archaeon]
MIKIWTLEGILKKLNLRLEFLNNDFTNIDECTIFSEDMSNEEFLKKEEEFFTEIKMVFERMVEKKEELNKKKNKSIYRGHRIILLAYFFNYVFNNTSKYFQIINNLQRSKKKYIQTSIYTILFFVFYAIKENNDEIPFKFNGEVKDFPIYDYFNGHTVEILSSESFQRGDYFNIYNVKNSEILIRKEPIKTYYRILNLDKAIRFFFKLSEKFKSKNVDIFYLSIKEYECADIDSRIKLLFEKIKAKKISKPDINEIIFNKIEDHKSIEIMKLDSEETPIKSQYLNNYFIQNQRNYIAIIFINSGILTESFISNFCDKFGIPIKISYEMKNDNFSNFNAYLNKLSQLLIKYSANPEQENYFTMQNFLEHCKWHVDNKIPLEAEEFIQEYKDKYLIYLISRTPKIFCELLKQRLGFSGYFSASQVQFDDSGKFLKIIGDKDGFNKKEITKKILKDLNFPDYKSVTISSSLRDIEWLNKSRGGTFIGKISEFDREKLSDKVKEYPSLKNEKFKTILNGNLLYIEGTPDEEVEVHHDLDFSGKELILKLSNEQELIKNNIKNVLDTNFRERFAGKKCKIVNLECGPGNLIDELKEFLLKNNMLIDAILIDNNKKIEEKFSERSDFRKVSVEVFVYRTKEKFDMIIQNFSLYKIIRKHEAPYPEEILNRIYEILAPQGIWIITMVSSSGFYKKLMNTFFKEIHGFEPMLTDWELRGKDYFKGFHPIHKKITAGIIFDKNQIINLTKFLLSCRTHDHLLKLKDMEMKIIEFIQENTIKTNGSKYSFEMEIDFIVIRKDSKNTD